MKKSVLVALAGLGMAAVGAQPAKAAPPVTACSTGALYACAAVSASTYSVVVNNHTQWRVKLDAWNLFGASGFSGVSSVITYVGLANSAWSGSFSLVSAKFGNVATSWSAANSFPNNLGAKIDVAANGNQGIHYGLIGCTQTKMFSTQLQSCYNDTNKALELVFNTSSQFNLTGAFWEVHGQVWNGGNCSQWWNSNGQSTTVINDQTGGACGNTVTPEPVTMALLGTGLLGMGGAGLVRRRKKNWDIENA